MDTNVLGNFFFRYGRNSTTISNIANKEKTGLLEMVVKEHSRYTQLIEISTLIRFLDLTGTLSGRYD